MSTGLASARPRLPVGPSAVLLTLLVIALSVAGVLVDQAVIGARFTVADLPDGVAGMFGIGDGLGVTGQEQFELRVWRGLVTAGVGALLAVAGALLQGLFQNGLASPSLIGVTAGANLGATVALLALGGYGVFLELESAWSLGPWLLTGSALAGALAVAVTVVAIASIGGRVSVATLLLIGVAINACIAGVMSAIQQLLIDSGDRVTQGEILRWTYGNLADRQLYHVTLVGAGLLSTAALLPFVTTELDLLATGEEDARSLGVATHRVRALVLLTAALATATAVAAAGQVGFVGLVVPHVVRMLFGAAHARVLPLSMLAGAALLLTADVGQLALLGERPLEPGVLMSLIGGPVFFAMLVARRRQLTW